jgi:DNA-directed RNA polymerase sigma subunit (sigma70/sigma32)
VDSFDPRLGNPFATYAGWCVQWAIRIAVADSARCPELVPEPDPAGASVLAAVEALPERPRRVLELRFGLDGVRLLRAGALAA